MNWKHYDENRLCECKKVLDLTPLFHELDKPIHRLEFKLSRLTNTLDVQNLLWIIIPMDRECYRRPRYLQDTRNETTTLIEF